MFRFPEHAATLEKIAAAKGEAFYRGELAEKKKLRPTPVTTRPADEVNAILEDLKGGKVLGRVVLAF